MRKILPPFFGIATIGWIIGGTIWFDKQLKQTEAKDFSNTSALQSSLVSKSDGLPKNICFNSGSAVPIFYKENLVELQNTADFLVKNSSQSLLLTGLSDSREQVKIGSLNLGFARAEAIKTTLTNFGAPNNSVELKSEQKEGILNAEHKVCDAVKMAFVENTDNHFQALNLFFKKNKFQFSETPELQAYFNDLHLFLEKNPTAKLKIAAHRSDTEGSFISKKRLNFIVQLLKNRRFKTEKLSFEDKKTAVATAVSNIQNLDNQRIEIRILTP
jgi:hypothetical protein